MSKEPTIEKLEQRIAELEMQKKATDSAMKQFDSYMTALHETALGILKELDLTTLLKNILQKASKLAGTDDGYIFMYDKEQDELVIKYGIGWFEKEIGFRLKPGEGLSGRILQSGEPMQVDDYDAWNGRHKHPGGNGMGFNLGIPLMLGDQLIGTIGLCSYDKEKKIGGNETLILSRFAELASIALHNANLHVELQNKLNQKIQTEKALRASEEKYRLLADNVTDVIWILDLSNMQMSYVSRSVQQVQGYTSEELMNLPLQEILTPESFKLASEIIFEELEKEATGTAEPLRARTVELEEFCKDGSTVWVELTASFLKNEKGETIGILGVSRDISERKRAEREKLRLENQLQQAQKMEAIGTLAGGIAHDFNNILAAVIGYAELAMIDAENDTELYSRLQEILQAGKRAKDLVKQILAFSRQAEHERKPVQVKAIGDEVLKLLRASLPTTIEIHQDFQSDSLIMADPTQIHQILLNLCTNAGHAMREKGGILEVKLEDVELDAEFVDDRLDLKPGKYLELTVSDSGSGIPKQILDRIFDPFFTTKEKGEGTGMGLAVVHGIVGSCGGRISAYSEPGQGSIFKVYLPIVEKQYELQAVAEEPIPTGSEHILFVDDEPVLAGMAKLILESQGYIVTTRTSSIEALELFKAAPDRFDLVISDLTMPKMTGDDLAIELIRIRPEIPVILCTGYSSRINPQNAMSMGVRAFLSKPVLKREMAETIRKVLDERMGAPINK